MVDGVAHQPIHMFPAGAAERQGQRAGVVSRTGAMVIDAGYAVALTGGLYLVVAGIRFLHRARTFSWPRIDLPEAVAVAAVVVTLALAIGWSSTGRSVGMRFMGLRLVTKAGSTLGVGHALVRAILCVAFPLGLFWCAASRRNASVQDLVLRTQVLYDWQSRVPAAGPSDA